MVAGMLEAAHHTDAEHHHTPGHIGPDGLPCQERKTYQHEIPNSFMAKTMLKSYFNSFQFLLGELGWVPQRILEVGSGDGSLLSYLAQTFMNAEVAGIELSASKIELAKENTCCRIEFTELRDGETLPFSDNQFDLVVSHGFLGTTATPRHWVQEMARVSAEGLIVSAPIPMGMSWFRKLPGAHHARLIGNPVFAPNNHALPFHQVQGWVKKAGLTVEATAMPLPYGMILGRKPQPAP